MKPIHRYLLTLSLVLATAFLFYTCSDRDPIVVTPTLFTVTFNSKGGSSVSSVVVKNGEKITEPATPTYSGFIFLGWYVDEAYQTKFDFTAAITSSQTLYAKWVKQNDATTMDVLSVAGYTISRLVDTFSIALPPASAVSNITVKIAVAHNAKLYKGGALPTGTLVTLDKDTASLTLDLTTPATFAVTAESGTITTTYTIKAVVQKASTKDITSVRLTKALNTYLASDVSGVINGTTITFDLPAGTDASKIKPSIVHNGVGVSPASDVEQNFVTQNTRTYVVIAEDGSTKTYTIVVNAPPVMVTVRFNVNGGTVTPDPIQVQYGTKVPKPSDPIRNGYQFLGWSSDKRGRNFSFDSVVRRDTLLIASWRATSQDAKFDQFIQTARFMPDDPRMMTADDKLWFNQNAAYTMKYRIGTLTDPAVNKPFNLTDEQLGRMKVYIESALKTFNYLVYTKSFALATKAMFADRAFYYKKDANGNNPIAPNELPSAVGTVLIMRGLNTDMLESGEILFNARNDDGNYIGSLRGSSVFDPAHDNFTDADIAANKRTSYLLPTESPFNIQIDIPVDTNLEALDTYEDIWMLTGAAMENLYKTDKKHKFARGFIFDLLIHELLHGFLKWNHVGGRGDGDLTYAYAGMAGWLMELRAEGRSILVNPTTFPSGGTVAEAQGLRNKFGGHLPMAYYGGAYAPFGFNNGICTYNLNTMYIQNQMNVPVFQPALSAGTLFVSSDARLFTNPNTKQVPANPFDGITFDNIKFLGRK